jgi:hypothetical protein
VGIFGLVIAELTVRSGGTWGPSPGYRQAMAKLA